MYKLKLKLACILNYYSCCQKKKWKGFLLHMFVGCSLLIECLESNLKKLHLEANWLVLKKKLLNSKGNDGLAWNYNERSL